MKNFETSVKLASTLIDNLTRFDSKGYDAQGYQSTVFLGAIARHGYIPEEDLQNYLNKVVELNEGTTWIRPEAADAMDYFIALVYVHTVYQTEATAQDIIKFGR